MRAGGPESIRRASLRDLDQLAALWRAINAHHSHLDPLFTERSEAGDEVRELLRAQLADTDSAFFVSERAGELVGFCAARIDRAPPILVEVERAQITDLFVVESLRRQGLARALVAAALDWVRAASRHAHRSARRDPQPRRPGFLAGARLRRPARRLAPPTVDSRGSSTLSTGDRVTPNSEALHPIVSESLHPIASELNRKLEAASPEVFAMLSALGRRLYFPKGILSQGAEAKAKAKRMNATIGIATEDRAPMHLPSLVRHLADLDTGEAVDYAPPAGRPGLRERWREKLLAENPSLRGKKFGLPIVTQRDHPRSRARRRAVRRSRRHAAAPRQVLGELPAALRSEARRAPDDLPVLRRPRLRHAGLRARPRGMRDARSSWCC